MGQGEHKGSALFSAVFWLLLIQIGYSVYVETQDLFNVQKSWPTAPLYGMVWKFHRAVADKSHLSMGSLRYVWHATALLQALAVGVLIDMLRKARGITQGS